ncbi:DUF6350 family protein [Kitasatospora sp. MAP5-34]|uniref:cell division protein PerM n=1 Tax=Kitasatospora sp. MAP5-34 TaxID=3035102 RepID=UPI002476742B|nr:DUF6350 family protein [Kitasatospora sp. MAP5-34]MDH6578119.1 hypothetical protein [Kitasatospora sp. MAP5-34]
MTQLMGRPTLGLPGELGARSVLADVLTGVRAALLTLALIAVPVLGLWVLTPYADDTAAGAGRLACALWLLGHGGPLVRGESAAPVTVTPLLPMAFTAALLFRTGARLGQRDRTTWRAALSVGAGYLAVVALAVADCGADGVLRARPVLDLLAVAGLVAAALGAGFRSVAGAWSPPLPGWVGRVPGWARPVDGGRVVRRAAGAGAAGLVAAGGLLLTVAVLVGAGAAGRSVQGLGGGVAGFAGLLLACSLLLPNAVLWAAAYALGTGFEVGTGTVVAPGGVRLGALPDFPLFALLPGPGGPGWQLAACGLPLLAGLVPAVLLGRAAGGRGERSGPPWHPAATVFAALGAALLAGAGAALCAWLAGGALAAGRMSGLGPVPWQAGLAVAAWLAAVTVPGATLVRWWLARAGAPSWWSRLTTRAVRRTAGARVALHRLLTWAADLPSPLAWWRGRT